MDEGLKHAGGDVQAGVDHAAAATGVPTRAAVAAIPGAIQIPRAPPGREPEDEQGSAVVAVVDPPEHRLDRARTFIGDEQLDRDPLAESGVRLVQPGLGRGCVLEHLMRVDLDVQQSSHLIGLLAPELPGAREPSERASRRG